MALAAAPLAAQAPDPVAACDALVQPDVERLLQSPLASDVAWGGYLAHRYRLRSAARALLAALQQWRDGDEMARREVRLHLVDGLLGAEARVPAEAVAFLLDDPLTRDGALALLAAEPVANLEALAAVAMAPAEGGDLARLAAAQLLVATGVPAPGFAAHLLARFGGLFVVQVEDGHPVDEQWNSAVGLGGGPPKTWRGEPDFPPLLRLQLTVSPMVAELRAVAPAVEGLEAVQLCRREGVEYIPSQLRRGERALALHEAVATNLLRGMTSVPFRRDVWIEVHWRDPASFVREATAARDAQREELDAMITALRRRGWLLGDELPAYSVPVTIEVQDRRGDTSTPLPQLPEPPAAGK